MDHGAEVVGPGVVVVCGVVVVEGSGAVVVVAVLVVVVGVPAIVVVGAAALVVVAATIVVGAWVAGVVVTPAEPESPAVVVVALSFGASVVVDEVSSALSDSTSGTAETGTGFESSVDDAPTDVVVFSTSAGPEFAPLQPATIMTSTTIVDARRRVLL